MPQKRMRVFAGPNGSGKTTILQGLKNRINLGVYVNADEIEKTLRNQKALPFSAFQLKVEEREIQDFLKASRFSPIKRNEPGLWSELSVDNNILYSKASIDSYLAADIAEFIRQRLLSQGISFTYETVMSHPDKIDFLQKAKDQEYRVYLYYVATEDPQINQNRVQIRVAQDGHAVDPIVIANRYYRSLGNLKEAIKTSNRSYLFDNSGEAAALFAEITDGVDVHILEPTKVPGWFIKYVVES